MGYWLFYAGPENYLCEQGERDFTAGEMIWSGAPGVRPGDLAALYRTSLSRLDIESPEFAALSPEVIRALRRRHIGSDIPLIWEVVSDDQGPFAKWANGYVVRVVTLITPPIALKELKADSKLRKWEDLRWNFQARGREALEIPEFAWLVLKEIIECRVGRLMPELGSSRAH